MLQSGLLHGSFRRIQSLMPQRAKVHQTNQKPAPKAEPPVACLSTTSETRFQLSDRQKPKRDLWYLCQKSGNEWKAENGCSFVQRAWQCGRYEYYKCCPSFSSQSSSRGSTGSFLWRTRLRCAIVTRKSCVCFLGEELGFGGLCELEPFGL